MLLMSIEGFKGSKKSDILSYASLRSHFNVLITLKEPENSLPQCELIDSNL